MTDLPVYERIVHEVQSRIELCTPANGYEFNVTKVVRRRQGEAVIYGPGLVEIICPSIVRDEPNTDNQSTGRAAWTMGLRVVIHALSSEGSIEPMETTLSRAERDVVASMDLADRFDLADDVRLASIERGGYDEENTPQTTLVFEIQCYTNETDLEVGRTD